MTNNRPEPTETTVIVPVPDAEPVVAGYRTRFDAAATWGVPAHVTVLYPFVPPARLDRQVIDQLQRLLREVPAFDCVFTECGWFGDEVLWLAPEPVGVFRALTARVFAAFPDFPPYGGQFDDVLPPPDRGPLRRDGRATAGPGRVDAPAAHPHPPRPRAADGRHRPARLAAHRGAAAVR